MAYEKRFCLGPLSRLDEQTILLGGKSYLILHPVF